MLMYLFLLSYIFYQKSYKHELLIRQKPGDIISFIAAWFVTESITFAALFYQTNLLRCA